MKHKGIYWKLPGPKGRLGNLVQRKNRDQGGTQQQGWSRGSSSLDGNHWQCGHPGTFHGDADPSRGRGLCERFPPPSTLPDAEAGPGACCWPRKSHAHLAAVRVGNPALLSTKIHTIRELIPKNSQNPSEQNPQGHSWQGSHEQMQSRRNEISQTPRKATPCLVRAAEPELVINTRQRLFIMLLYGYHC